MAADSTIGVTPTDTGELFVGRVVVTPVFLESNGQVDSESQNFTTEEIEQTLATIHEGLAFWTDLLASLNTVHTLEFVVDDTFATTPFETPFEPIDRPSSDLALYASDFFVSQGFGGAGTLENASVLFNHQQRLAHDADWAFTIVVVDSSDDEDGFFAPGGNFRGAFAFPGGRFVVTPSARPASTIAHEIGHIFYARDEYPGGGSFTDRRGYYNAQNLNAFDNPAEGFVQQPSILANGQLLEEAFENTITPASTLAFLGWRDSDGDGIFDFADVPLHLEGVGSFDDASSTYRFVGSASAVPLRNLNSSGNQSDITLNEISLLEYRLDGGPWQTAQTLETQQAQLDVSFEILQDFQTIELRVRDAAIGVTSPIVEGTAEVPATSSASISAFAFLDESSDGQRTFDEMVLGNLQARVRHADGSELFQNSIAASDFAAGGLPEAAAVGITLSAEGDFANSQIEILESVITGQNTFQSFDFLINRPIDGFGERVALAAQFDSTVGEVHVTIAGTGDGSYGRIEAFDAMGNEITRVTSSALAAAESSTLSLFSPAGDIHTIRVFGHAGTSIAVSEIQAGSSGLIQTDDTGVLQLANLPDGQYSIELTPELIIHRFSSLPSTLTVSSGTSEPLLLAAAERVDSFRHNTAETNDVNADQLVSPLDALLIVNELQRRNAGGLTNAISFEEIEGDFIDVNNDGRVTPLDALIVVNQLASEAAQSNQPEVFDRVGQSVPQVQPVLAPQRVDRALARTNMITVEMFNLAGRESTDESWAMLLTDTTGELELTRFIPGDLGTTEKSEQKIDLSKASNDHEIALNSLSLEIDHLSVEIDG